MNTKIYPRVQLPPLPQQAEQTTAGIRAGRIAGVIVSAALWATFALTFWIGLFDIPSRDYAAVALMGAGASLIFSFPYLFK